MGVGYGGVGVGVCDCVLKTGLSTCVDLPLCLHALSLQQGIYNSLQLMLVCREDCTLPSLMSSNVLWKRKKNNLITICTGTRRGHVHHGEKQGGSRTMCLACFRDHILLQSL